MKKIILSTFVIVYFLLSANAQQIPINNFYLDNPYSFNPAATGILGNITACADYTDQWTGIKDAPENANFGLHGLITKVMGVGLKMSSFKMGIFRQNKISLNYSYRLAFAEQHTLGFGFSLGILKNSTSLSTIEQELTVDPALYSNNFNETLFETGFGLHYNFENINVHFSTPVFYGNQEKKYFQNALAMVSYDYVTPDDIWTIRPVVFYRYTLYQHMFDGVVSASWNNRLTLQAGYRTNKNIIAGAGINIKGLHISYIYEVNGTELKSASNGGHQIMLMFESPFSVNKKRPLYHRSNRRRSAWD